MLLHAHITNNFDAINKPNLINRIIRLSYMLSALFADSDDDISSCANEGRVVVVSASTVNDSKESTKLSFQFVLKVAEDEFNSNKKSLFATFIWSGSIKLAEKLIEYRETIKDSTVLEFGAAAGLPSLVCGRLLAKRVCSSDYPSQTVIDVLKDNIAANTSTGAVQCTEHHVVPHIWGEDVTPLTSVNNNEKFDVVLAAECLWKHDSHDVFIISIINSIRIGGTLMLSFSHHIAGLEACDLEFLVKLAAAGFAEREHVVVKANHMWDTDRLVDIHIVVLVYRPDSELL